MKIRVSKKDIVWSYIGTGITLGANIIILPFMMYYMDGDLLGLWYIFTSLGGITALFDFGFSVTFARNITYCWSGARILSKENVHHVKNMEPDFGLMKDVLITCKVVYAIISFAALALLLSIGTIYIVYVSRALDRRYCMLAWLIYALSVFLNLYFGYYASFLRGVGAVAQANKNMIIARTSQIILTIVTLRMGMGLIGACISYLVYGLIFRISGKHFFYTYSGIGEKINKESRQISKKRIKELTGIVWHNAWRDGIISICNYFCNQASTLICSMFLSLTETGVYSIGVQIATAISQLAGTMYTAYQPQLQAEYVNQDKNKLRKNMSMIVMSYVYFFIILTIGVIAAGIPVLKIIKPDLVVSVSVMSGLCFYQFILKFRNCYTSYYSCTNRIPYLNSFLISAVLCVVGSYISLGVLHLGIWGLIFVQIFSQLVFNAWYWPWKVHQELHINLSTLLLSGSLSVLEKIRDKK